METARIAITYCIAIVVLAVLFLKINDRLFHRSKSKKELEEYSERFKERLQNPDFPALEKHYNCTFPQNVKDLYANKNDIMKGDFEVQVGAPPQSFYVAYYMPADAEAIRDFMSDTKEYFAFANDGCGNDYLITPRDPTSEILLHDHETDELTHLGVNFAGFLSAPRKQAA
jgi:hypothetical protein